MAVLLLRLLDLPGDPLARPHALGGPVVAEELAGDELRKYVDEGLLEDDGRRVRLSREGRFLADRVLSALV